MQVDAIEQRAGELARYFCTAASSQRQSEAASPRKPHGQGFIDATSVKRAGNVSVPGAREIVTVPSSSGDAALRASERENSPSSSRKSTPYWASEISPGRGKAPPPTSETQLAVWCGARNGRVGDHARRAPEQSRDAVDLRHVERLGGRHRRQDRRHAARQHRLAAAGRPDQHDVVSACRRDLERALRERLSADVGEVAERRRGPRSRPSCRACGTSRRARARRRPRRRARARRRRRSRRRAPPRRGWARARRSARSPPPSPRASSPARPATARTPPSSASSPHTT